MHLVAPQMQQRRLASRPGALFASLEKVCINPLRLVLIRLARLDRNIQTFRKALHHRANIMAISHSYDGAALRAVYSQHFEVAIFRRNQS